MSSFSTISGGNFAYITTARKLEIIAMFHPSVMEHFFLGGGSGLADVLNRMGSGL